MNKKCISILIALTVCFAIPAHAARTFLKPFFAAQDASVFTFQSDANPDGETFISGAVTKQPLTIGTDTYNIAGYFIAKVGRHGGVIWIKSISDLANSMFFIDPQKPKKCELAVGSQNVVIALHSKLLLINFDGKVLDQNTFSGILASGGLSIHKENNQIAVVSQVDDKQLLLSTYTIDNNKFAPLWQKNLSLEGTGTFASNGVAIDDIGDVYLNTQINDLVVGNSDDVWIEVDGRSGYSSKDAFIVKDSSTKQIKDLKGMFNGKGDAASRGIIKSPELLYNEPLNLEKAVKLVNMKIKGISLSYMTYTMEFWSKGLVTIYYGGKDNQGDMEFEIGEESSNMVEFEQEYDSGDDYGQVEYELKNASDLHHWAAVFDGRYIKMYCDGILINQLEADPIEVDTDKREFRINGTIDEFRLWTVERKAEEIRENFQKRVTGNEGDLLVCYRPLNNKQMPQTVLIRLDNNDGNVVQSRALTWDDGLSSGICHSGGILYLSQQSDANALIRSYNIMLAPKKSMIIAGDSASEESSTFLPGVIAMKPDIEGNLLVLGSTAKGTTSFYDASASSHIDAAPFIERNSSNKGFFIGRWDGSLDCDWIQFSNASTSARIVSDFGYGDLIQDPKDSDWIFFNGSFSNGSLSFGGTGESNVINAVGQTDAFMCGIRPDGNFLKEVSLEIVSNPDALIEVDHEVLPKPGKATYLEGTSFEASVPEMIQQNAIIEGQTYTDVIRYVCTGFNVEGSITGGTENRYVFTLNEDMRLIFNWQKKIAVIVETQFENTNKLSEAFGNPEPAVGRHYYNNKDRVILQIDGMVKSYENPGTRHVVTKYSKNAQLFAIDEIVEDRFQVTQFTVTEPALVKFYWARQYRIQVSTSGSDSSDLPAICSLNSSGNITRQASGIGEFWFDSNAHVQVMAKEHQNLMALSGWFNGSGQILSEGELSSLKSRTFNSAIYRYIDIQSLISEMTLTWNYGDRIFRETVQIGNPIRFISVPPDIRSQREKDQSPASTTLVESPPDSTPSNMYLWSDYEKRLYPLRPGKFLMEWQMQGTDDQMITEITSVWPDEPDYIHVANTPPVLVDISDTDERIFKSLIYTESEASIGIDKTFECLKRGSSLLYYTQKNYFDTKPLDIYLSFDGIDDAIDMGSEISLKNTPFTIEFWARRASVNKKQIVISQDAENMGLEIGFNENNTFSFSFDDNALDTPITYSDTDWHHYAVAFNPDGYTRYIFVDSIQIVSDALEDAPYTHEGNIFAAKSNDYYFHGDIDHIKIYQTVRTQAEIASSMNSSLSGNDTGLAAWFPLNRSMASPYVPDASGNLPIASLENMDLSAAWQFHPDFERQPAMGDLSMESVILKSVRTDFWNDHLVMSNTPVAAEIKSAFHDSQVPHNGYIFWEKARYNIYTHDRTTRKGPLFAVNTQYTPTPEDDLVIIWYRSQDQINWPWQPEKFTAFWPEVNNRIVIASRFGSEGKDRTGKDQLVFFPSRYQNVMLYYQPDPEKGGYNPNEEHAGIFTSFRYITDPNPPRAAYALKNYLNITTEDESFTSRPYVLVQYTDSRINQTGMIMYDIEVKDESMGYTFEYPITAGEPVVAPYPLNEVIGANPPAEIYGEAGELQNQISYWEDHKGFPWCVSGNTFLYAYFYYPLDPTFWHAEKQPGETICFSMTNGVTPQQIKYNSVWPEEVPVLKIGETLTFQGGEYRSDHPSAPGLPGVLGWAAGQIIYDSLNPTMNPDLFFSMYQIRLTQVLEPVTVNFDAAHMPESLKPESGNTVSGNYWMFKDLSAGLKKRLYYDYIMKKLCFAGFLNDKTLGDEGLMSSPPSLYVLQPNIMTVREKEELMSLPGVNNAFRQAVERLFELSRDPDAFNTDFTVGVSKQTIADSESGKTTEVIMQSSSPGPGLAAFCNPYLVGPTYPYTSGYAVLAENNMASLGDIPVSLHIIKLDKEERFRGAIKVIESDNVFDEKIVLRHSSDFGSNPDDLIFEWWYREEDGVDQLPPGMAPSGTWRLFPDTSGRNGLGMNEICMAGTGKILLVDNLFFVRYRHKNSPDTDESWTLWAGAANNYPHMDIYQAQLAYGWVKRVFLGINPYEVLIDDFTGDSPIFKVTMIQKAGPRYEGDVALNPNKDVIESLGMIELYQTVLNRAKKLSIDLSQPATSSGVTAALLLAAGRIVDFNMYLGNAAYNDAVDPCLNIGSDDVEYLILAPAIFSFMNMVPSLIEEELIMLRGQDSYGAKPVYNRLIWNFTKSYGEAAYVINYQIDDYDLDGIIDESDARALYPQGHGDAWGYYLTAVKTYYDLLRHDVFNYEARSEKFQIDGVVFDVDYLDERKFAEAAAARAKTGSAIVNMTYRASYVEDPDGQWQGYQDTDSDRAWGVEEWGLRAGMAAFFDASVANALLPAKDTNPTHTGIRKVERKYVKELADIAFRAKYIQQEIENASSGVNPLGIANETVPFDIDNILAALTEADYETHFEQMYERAKTAIENALRVYNYMNSLVDQIRQIGNEVDNLRNNSASDDLDFRARAIEIFGSPYEGTIGSGKTYPTGYKGPDIYYYNFIDINEISNNNIPEPASYVKLLFEPGNLVYTVDKSQNLEFNDIDAVFTHFLPQDFPNGYNASWDSAEFRQGVIEVEYPVTAGDYSFIAPSDWGIRRTPGAIQQCLINMVQEQAELELTIAEYTENVHEIKNIIMEIQARSELFSEVMTVQNDLYVYVEKVHHKLIELEHQIAVFEGLIEYIEDMKDALIEGLPTVVGLSNDPSSAARAALDLGILATKIYSTHQINDLNIEIAETESDKELMEMSSDLQIQMAEYRNDIQSLLIDLNRALVAEPAARLNIFKQREVLREAGNILRSTITEGLNIIQERSIYNTSLAESIQSRSYHDMTLRVSQNKAISEYHALFDTAARYVYLAAKIYDYETSLSHDHPLSALPLLTKIVKERTLGLFDEHERPNIGMGGLGELLGKLANNYNALKLRMGIANPQNETGRFSIRSELFRIKPGMENDKLWQDTLERYRVDNLWDVPEFKRFCRPVAPRSAGAQPGIAISFQTSIKHGQNFFGWPLGSADNAYDASNFATRIQSVGLWFENYDNSQLSETPRAYLVPAGMDVMYAADSYELDTREWHIIDQRIPVPIPVSETDIENPQWISNIDSVDIPGYSIRRFTTIRAYHDSGYFNEEEMTFDTRLIGRSVWNSRWLLIIPGSTFLADPDEGLDIFIHGQKVPGSEERDQNGVKDIKVFFQTYAIAGD